MKRLTAALTSAIAPLVLATPTTANPIYLPNNTEQVYSYPAQIYSYPTRQRSTPYRRYPTAYPFQIPASSPTPVIPGPILVPPARRPQIPAVIQPSIQVYPHSYPVYRQTYPNNGAVRRSVYWQSYPSNIRVNPLQPVIFPAPVVIPSD